MRVGLILILLLLTCAGCGKPESHDITIWRMPKTNGLSIEIANTPLSETMLDRILHKATQQYNVIGLVVCLPPGVSITNAFDLLAMAERFGITKTEVRINQTRLPPQPTKGDDVIYSIVTKEAPSGQAAHR